MGSFNFAIKTSPISLSPDFIVPDDGTRPLPSELVSSTTSIPTIDLTNIDHTSLTSQISNACENYGCFQIINHGVSADICKEMMAMANEFFELPSEDRAKLYSEDRKVQVRVGTTFRNSANQEKVYMWNEYFTHPGHPIADINHLLPQNPARYGDVAATYAEAIANLVDRLFDLVSEGLGLEANCLQTKLSRDKIIFQQSLNFYPPCPHSEVTLGLPAHTDQYLITVLQQVQGVSGLQMMKDGKWLAADPLPDSFIVIIGDLLEVMSNGRYKSVLHRAVSNQEMPRMSIGTFCKPTNDAYIGPLEGLINEKQPPIYQTFSYGEFLQEYGKQVGVNGKNVRQIFQVQN